MGKLLKKEDLNKFLYKIKTKQELVAPVETDAVRFETVKFISQIILDKIPEFPPKKYFLPSNDEMFQFRGSKILGTKKQPSRIIFGIRQCDVNAINVLDKVFLGKNPDPLYKERREKTTLIAIKCSKEIEKNCFCTSMNLSNFADLYFHDIGDSFFIEVGSDKGLKLVSRLKDYEYQTGPINTKKRLFKKDIARYYNNKAWKDAANKCISCGICTNVCPTCLCYKQKEFSDTKTDIGTKKRSWVSCQHKNFWEDTDENAMDFDKTKMLKHRVYHKLSYFKKNYRIGMCTGCGRCITQCPAKIDFVKIINKFK
ncbi:hypothetical protein GOV08_01895 [Candidatus Woesearchaeota archaeon]|nr:hypothetical protein [Candidatus Woesearchaeota archaeon]